MDTAALPTSVDSSWMRGPLFQGLSENELRTLVARTSVRHFDAGEILIRQDVWCGELFIIREGVVQVSVERSGAPGTSSHDVPVRRMSTGDIVGEGSLITGSLPSATVQAITDGQALVLPQDDFLQLVRELPRLSRRVSAILGERLRSSNKQIAEQRAQQVILVVGEPGLWGAIASTMARLSDASVLHVDLHATSGYVPTLSDLMNGWRTDSNRHVMGVRASTDEIDCLAALLSRAGNEHRNVLITAPQPDTTLSGRLPAFADKIVVMGSIVDTSRVRSWVEALGPQGAIQDIGVVLTDAAPGVVHTTSITDKYGALVGAPVRAILPAAPAQKHIEGLSRWLVGQRIGVALGAGGAKGWAHVGVIRALRNAGVPIDVITGVSIGAIVGAAAAMNRDADWMEHALEQAISRILRPTFPIRSLLSSRSLVRYLRRDVFGDTCIEDTPIPLAVSAVDLNEGGEIVLRHGPIWQAVLASAAIPGIYPAVRIGSHYLVDGGVVNPVPVETARQLGADVVIAVDLSVPLAPQRELDSSGSAVTRAPFVVNNVLRSRDIMMSVIRTHSVAEPSVLVKPPIEEIGLRNFREGSRFVSAGEEAMERALPTLQQYLPWLGTQSTTSTPSGALDATGGR